MKKATFDHEDGLLPEYNFDYKKAKQNRFYEDELVKKIKGYFIFKDANGSFYILSWNCINLGFFSALEDAEKLIDTLWKDQEIQPEKPEIERE